MAGFFALRRSCFHEAQGLAPLGFKILLELVVRARIRRIREVPIQFAARKEGRSKLTLRQQLAYLRHLTRLYAFRFPGAQRLLRFLTVGASGMLVDLAAFFLLLRALPLGLSVALAIWCAMSWNFLWNRRWTFADARPRPLLAQYVLFCASCLLGAALNWSVSVSLIRAVEFFRRAKLAARLLGIAAGTAFNYCLSALVVFRPQTPQEPPGLFAARQTPLSGSPSAPRPRGPETGSASQRKPSASGASAPPRDERRG